MTSTVNTDKLMNSSGDQDSGLDLATNDTVKIKTANTDRVTVTNSNVIINEDSADVDFRVESNGNANMLFVDGGNDCVGIGLASPASYNTHSDDLVVGGADGNRGITIVGGDDDYSIINLNRASNTSTTPNGAIEYNHTDNAMYIKAGGTTSMTIDSTGRILTPARPCFSARKNRASGGATGYQGDPLVFDVENFDIGGNFNTTDGKFTTPVAGVYQFSFVGFGCSSSGGPLPDATSIYVQISRDGTTFGSSSYGYSNGATSYPNVSFTLIQQLNAGEEIAIHVLGAYCYADTTHKFDPLFCGHLIG